MKTSGDPIARRFPVTTRIQPELLGDPDLAHDLPRRLVGSRYLDAHPFLAEVAALEQCYRQLESTPCDPFPTPETRVLNPSLEMLEVNWRHLATLFSDAPVSPEPGKELLLLYRHPESCRIILRPAEDRDLLVLKIVAEELSSSQVSKDTGLSIGQVDDLLHLGEQNGLILAPRSRLIRPSEFPRSEHFSPDRFTAPTFTLQWHITQTCDLHCKHCYDRSERQPMPLERGLAVLDDLYEFSRNHHVFTQVTFTGGNPLLYPYFLDLYQGAAERGFLTAILGNPMPRHRIEEMIEVQMPEFYQVSLEGLEEHNDYIRGRGHFHRVLDFLDLLRELGVYSMVMLTLTRDNMDQVIDLARLLQGRVDLFTFNRLAMVGEGAALASVPIADYPDFLRRYQEAAGQLSCMGFKDNFFNLLRYQGGSDQYTGGCAGYGCGAAFNFLSLLPDGEVHACRKLPSYLGNIYSQTLDTIYHSPLAKRYRLGSAECRECPIRPVCGGCPAVSYGFGRDLFKERDPYCFIFDRQQE